MVRVRFAPSPTGYLHIGGGRTALFNWLYARAKQGKFILRIEDTDAGRSRKEYLDEILDSVKWLGFDWDEIYYQSARFDIYRDYADRLLKEGHAYQAECLVDEEDCVADTVDAESSDVECKNSSKASVIRQKAIVFRVPRKKVRINDLIHGPIEFDTVVIKDQVLIKSDGTPTYNFACVVDDASMNITHVIRGDDHISNTPKQIVLYEALGFNIPQFAHLPLILGKEGGRLSKRTGATAISDYRKMGYLPDALVNYLLLLGWAPGGNREIIDIKEAIRLFDIKKANKTAATFDIGKLNWINNQYIRNASTEKLLDLVIPSLAEKNWINPADVNRPYIMSIRKLFQARITTLRDFPDWADFFFTDDYKMDEDAKSKYLSRDFSREFKMFAERLEQLETYDILCIEEVFRKLVWELNLEAKVLIHPIRVALTGKSIGPGLFEMIYCLGKERAIWRLMKWVKS